MNRPVFAALFCMMGIMMGIMMGMMAGSVQAAPSAPGGPGVVREKARVKWSCPRTATAERLMPALRGIPQEAEVELELVLTPTPGGDVSVTIGAEALRAPAEWARIAEEASARGFSCGMDFVNAVKRQVLSVCLRTYGAPGYDEEPKNCDTVSGWMDPFIGREVSVARKLPFVFPGDPVPAEQRERVARMGGRVAAIPMRNPCSVIRTADDPMAEDWVRTESFVREQLPKILGNRSERCRREILAEYINGVDKTLRAGCAQADVKGCEVLKERSASLLSLLGKVYPDDVAKVKSRMEATILNQMADCVRGMAAGAVDPGEFVSELERLAACTRLKKGESRVFQNDAFVSSDVPANYLLHRKGEKEFVIALNFDFSPEDPALPPNKAKRMAAEMRKHVQGCYEKVSPGLKGPGGQKITLQLVDRNVAYVPGERVGLHQETFWERIFGWFRAHSQLFSTGQDCLTLLHETLHHLGLVDTYKETVLGMRYDAKAKKWKWANRVEPDEVAFDCRAVGRDRSIMHDQWSTWMSLGETGSLLTPAQFAVITSPGCRQAAPKYYECAPFAYRTSERRGGDGCGGEVPAACRQSDWED